MEELVAQLTQALMLHAVDLSAITNSQVMVVVETPTGAEQSSVHTFARPISV